MKKNLYKPEEAKINPNEKFYHLSVENFLYGRIGTLTFCSILSPKKDQVKLGWSFCNEQVDQFSKTWGRVLARRRALHNRTGITQPFTEKHRSAEAIVECFNLGIMPKPFWMNGVHLDNAGAKLLLDLDE